MILGNLDEWQGTVHMTNFKSLYYELVVKSYNRDAHF